MLRKLFPGQLLTLLLTLLLLMGQQGVLAHEITHLQDYNQHDQTPHHTVCDQCLSLANLDNLIPGSSYLLPNAHPHTDKPASSNVLMTLQFDRSAYSARAPPSRILF